jgi:hypothetical protein
VCPIRFLTENNTLTENGKKQLQTNLGGVKLIIRDECSMLGLKMLGQIDKTFNIVAGNIDEDMGGVQFMLSGDFYQLNAVKYFQLYQTDTYGIQAGFNS